MFDALTKQVLAVLKVITPSVANNPSWPENDRDDFEEDTQLFRKSYDVRDCLVQGDMRPPST